MFVQVETVSEARKFFLKDSLDQANVPPVQSGNNPVNACEMRKSLDVSCALSLRVRPPDGNICFLCPALAEHTVFVVSVRNESRRVRSNGKSLCPFATEVS